MKETDSVYELESDRHQRVFEIMDTMKVIMVKGIGYVVVPKGVKSPETFRMMGEAVAKTFEE